MPSNTVPTPEHVHRGRTVPETTRERYTRMLRKFDDPILKTVCEPVKPGDDLGFLRDMRKVCNYAGGIGLAAPQIGVAKRAVFIWPGQAGMGYFMLNPVIVGCGGFQLSKDEGCLSYPGVRVNVKRYGEVRVTFLDDRMQHRHKTVRGHEAVIVQHEIDHLDGACRVGDAWRERPSAVEIVMSHVRPAPVVFRPAGR
jgi:peptide deformylase